MLLKLDFFSPFQSSCPGRKMSDTSLFSSPTIFHLHLLLGKTREKIMGVVIIVTVNDVMGMTDSTPKGCLRAR